jgi:predicted nicotinamide N-methyase
VALAYARRNAASNGLTAGDVDFAVLDWEAPDVTERFDLVLGTEILYDYNLHGALLALLPRLLAPGGTVLFVDRRRLVVDRFFGRLRDRGFTGRQTDHTLALPGESEQTVTVFHWAKTDLRT